MLNTASKKMTALVVVAVLGTQALAANADTLPEERRGAVIGGIIGASVGGPIGAGVGAIVGGGLVGRAIGEDHRNDALQHRLARSEARSEAREKNLKSVIARLGDALHEAKLAQATTRELDLPIQFRTGSSAIEAHYQQDLQRLAQALSVRPDVQVDLAGYADRRGDSDYNQKLSELRVQQVKDFLVTHGVDARRISTRAFGETRPVAKTETVENDFFDRRVVMTFSSPADESPVAAR